MAANPGNRSSVEVQGDRHTRHLSTETEAAPKTTEFILTVASIAGVLVAALLIEGGDTNGTDEFIARQA